RNSRTATREYGSRRRSAISRIDKPCQKRSFRSSRSSRLSFRIPASSAASRGFPSSSSSSPLSSSSRCSEPSEYRARADSARARLREDLGQAIGLFAERPMAARAEGAPIAARDPVERFFLRQPLDAYLAEESSLPVGIDVVLPFDAAAAVRACQGLRTDPPALESPRGREVSSMPVRSWGRHEPLAGNGGDPLPDRRARAGWAAGGPRDRGAHL